MFKSRKDEALKEISNWCTDEVVSLLRENRLEKCCEAVIKKQIDGAELLQLTKEKLEALWRRDLNISLIWSFSSFLEELKKSPEKYVEERKINKVHPEGDFSDSDNWGPEEFDDGSEDSVDPPPVEDRILRFLPERGEFERNSKKSQGNSVTASGQIANQPNLKKCDEPITETLYTNFESSENPEAENTYANYEVEEMEPNEMRRPQKNASKLYSGSLSAKRKTENLEIIRKPVLPSKKPEIFLKKLQLKAHPPNVALLSNRRESPTDFQSKIDKGNSLRRIPQLVQQIQSQESPVIERKVDEPVRPPGAIQNLDLVADLPMGSEDEYEIIDQDESTSSGKQSVFSSFQSSAESIDKPKCTTTHEDNEDEGEMIYELISEESEDQDHYLHPISRLPRPKALPLWPPNPPSKSTTPYPTSSLRKLEIPKERSPDKSATLPLPESNTFLAVGRASRPLPPPPPEGPSYLEKPWFHNVNREEAIALIKKSAEGTYCNPPNGRFLMRPSSANPRNPFTLVLWYQDRVYNVPVRKRSDNKYALGSEKAKEQTFGTVEDIVTFYMKEELVLHTSDMETGNTKLTDTPAK